MNNVHKILANECAGAPISIPSGFVNASVLNLSANVANVTMADGTIIVIPAGIGYEFDPSHKGYSACTLNGTSGVFYTFTF